MTPLWNSTTRLYVGFCVAVVLATTSTAWGQAATRPAAEAESAVPAATGPRIGKIKGDNVYIRSGSHVNYYPVSKLNRGDPVTVVGEQYGWFEILPPAGTYSLVEKTFVDRNGNTGTLNGERWVNAGSTLDKARYAKQVKLSKGATVHILGETDDGAYFKIEPPPGAHLWVSGDFVEGVSLTGAAPRVKPPDRVAPGELGLDGQPLTTTRPAGATTRPSEGGIVMRTTPAGRTNARRNATPSVTTSGPATDSDKFQPQISAIEAEIQAENIKPFTERAYERVLGKLVPLAEQTEDEVAALYAKTRIEQIEGYTEAQAALRRIAQLKGEALIQADREKALRENMPKAADVLPADMIVVTGEIRASNVYTGTASRPKRWRIVDPAADSGRTLAYIELPPNSTINPADFFGKAIGIKASARKVASDTIPPIPIYTVAEIVLMDSSTRPARVGGSQAYASPLSPRIASPASQPTTAPSTDLE